MAYWYTYPTSPSSSSESDEETNGKSDKEWQKLFDTERDFYQDIGNHPLFYAFHTKDYIAWNMRLYRPIYRHNPLWHFANIVDIQTMRLIRKGTRLKTQYYHIPCGDVHLERDALQFIFQKASEWVEFNNLHRNTSRREYINNVMWVAAKLIRFQMKHK
jgi:hypothetical protein